MKHKLIKWLLPSLVCIISVLCMSKLITANDTPTYDNIYIENGESGYTDDKIKTTLFTLQDSSNNEIYTYCVDNKTPIIMNTKYSKCVLSDSDYFDETQANHIKTIVLNSYPFIPLKELQQRADIEDLTIKDAITASQFAIWHFSNNQNYDSKYKNVNALYNWLISLEPGVSVYSANKDITLTNVVTRDGNTYSSVFKFKADLYNADGSLISLSYGIDDETMKKYPDIKISDKTTDNEGFSVVTVSNIPKNISVKFYVNGEQTKPVNTYLYQPEGGNKASQSLVGIITDKTPLSKSIDVNTITTDNALRIKKVDSVTGNGLEGAVFEISDTQDFSGQIYTLITDKDGYAYKDDLTPGDWYVREVKAPSGYICYEVTFVVSVGEGITECECKNVAFGTIEILKVDQNNKPVKGAVFDIYEGEQVSGNPKYSGLISDENGRILKGEIVPGKYTVVETSAPDGYLYDTTPVTIEVKPGSTETVTFTNHKIVNGSLAILKRDAVSKESMSGCVIAIYSDPEFKNELKQITTVKDTPVMVNDLKPGTYYLKEIKCPDGYLLDSNPQTVTLKEGETVEVTFYNNRVPKTAGNFGFTLVCGVCLLAVFVTTGLVFRKHLIKKNTNI